MLENMYDSSIVEPEGKDNLKIYICDQMAPLSTSDYPHIHYPLGDSNCCVPPDSVVMRPKSHMKIMISKRESTNNHLT